MGTHSIAHYIMTYYVDTNNEIFDLNNILLSKLKNYFKYRLIKILLNIKRAMLCVPIFGTQFMYTVMCYHIIKRF